MNTKKTVILFAALSLAAALAGCGAASSAASSTASSAADSAPASSEVQEPAASSLTYDYDAELDYTDIYRNGNDDDADTVELTKNEDASYDVYISIYRLCELTGTGSIMDGAVELTLTDPNGNEMTAIFYPADEYTYAFKVTTSTWEYLPEGTEITGFQGVDEL